MTTPGPASDSVSTAARQVPSQQPRTTSTNTVTTSCKVARPLGSRSVIHSLPEGFRWVRQGWPTLADRSNLPSITDRKLSALAHCSGQPNESLPRRPAVIETAFSWSLSLRDTTWVLKQMERLLKRSDRGQATRSGTVAWPFALPRQPLNPARRALSTTLTKERVAMTTVLTPPEQLRRVLR